MKKLPFWENFDVGTAIFFFCDLRLTAKFSKSRQKNVTAKIATDRKISTKFRKISAKFPQNSLKFQNPNDREITLPLGSDCVYKAMH